MTRKCTGYNKKLTPLQRTTSEKILNFRNPNKLYEISAILASDLYTQPNTTMLNLRLISTVLLTDILLV